MKFLQIITKYIISYLKYNFMLLSYMYNVYCIYNNIPILWENTSSVNFHIALYMTCINI